MQRSVERVRLTVPDITVGELVVAGGFVHPRRGRVRCAAAPLVAASIGGADVRMLGGRPGLGDDESRHDGGGVLFAVSYLGRDGGAVGLGVAAHSRDRAGLAAARDAVDSWAAVLRTRRVLLPVPGPRCAGVDRMVERIGRLRANGDIPFVGADGLDHVPDGAEVIFPAHGVSLAVRGEAVARGMRVVDATCPLVAATHDRLREFAERGDLVVLIGRAGHPVVAGLVGQAPESVLLVETVADVGALAGVDPQRLSFVLAPGAPVEDTARLLAALRSRFPGVRGQRPEEWCYAASDRREALRSVSAASDLLLVCGAADDPDTQEVVGWAGGDGVRTRRITDAGEIRASWLASAATVGLATGASGRPGLVDEVIEALSGLGPLSIARRHVTTSIGQVPVQEQVPGPVG